MDSACEEMSDSCSRRYTTKEGTEAYSKQVLDLGGVNNLKGQFDHPEQEEREDISRGDARARREMIGHILPRVAEDASENDTQVLRTKICLDTEPYDGHHGADPHEEIVPVHPKDTPC